MPIRFKGESNAIRELKVVLEKIYLLSDQIKIVNQKLSDKIDAIDKKLSDGIDAVDKKFSSLEERLSADLKLQEPPTNNRVGAE